MAGIAFPTCVSLNECVCHQSPLGSDKEIVLQAGDLVKVYENWKGRRKGDQGKGSLEEVDHGCMGRRVASSSHLPTPLPCQRRTHQTRQGARCPHRRPPHYGRHVAGGRCDQGTSPVRMPQILAAAHAIAPPPGWLPLGCAGDGAQGRRAARCAHGRRGGHPRHSRRRQGATRSVARVYTRPRRSPVCVCRSARLSSLRAPRWCRPSTRSLPRTRSRASKVRLPAPLDHATGRAGDDRAGRRRPGGPAATGLRSMLPPDPTKPRSRR